MEGETVPGALEVSGVLEALPVPGEPPAACGGGGWWQGRLLRPGLQVVGSGALQREAEAATCSPAPREGAGVALLLALLLELAGT